MPRRAPPSHHAAKSQLRKHTARSVGRSAGPERERSGQHLGAVRGTHTI